MILSSDWRAFIASLNSKNVEYVLVGGHAVAYHAPPRFTSDLELYSAYLLTFYSANRID